MALNKDIKVGLLAILSLVAMIVGVLFMKGTLFHSGNPEYHANFSNVDNLKVSDKVYLNGIIIGMITAIEFEDINQPDKIKVSFNTDEDLRIPMNSKIQIVSKSIMGEIGLDLIMGRAKNYVEPGQYIDGVSPYGIMEKLTDNISPLAENSDSVLQNINSLFNRNQNDNLYATINQLNRTLSSMNGVLNTMNSVVVANQKPLNSTMKNFEKMSYEFSKNQENINQAINNLRSITEKTNKVDVEGMMNNLNSSVNKMNALMTSMNSSEGSLGLLMKDRQLYDNLNSTAKNANELMIDIKSSPKRYVGFSIFGGKK